MNTNGNGQTNKKELITPHIAVIINSFLFELHDLTGDFIR